MSDQPRLFDVPDPVVEPGERLSDGRRLTLRNEQIIASGFHPATHLPLHADANLLKCGGCIYLKAVQGGGRSFWKCDNHVLGHSHSAHSDVRKRWPACVLYRREP